jgi:SAM-dependent methyltransferase
MVDLANANAKAKDGPLDFQEMNAEDLRFPDGGFDAALCHLGLMLFADPGKALREMARVCRPGGRVVCLVQGAMENMVFTSLVMRSVVKNAPHLKPPPGAPTLYSFGGPGALEAAFEAAGLAQVESGRLSDSARFPSPEVYWDALTTAAGCMRHKLQGMAPETREAIRTDVLRQSRAYLKDGRLELPIEMVMARGLRPA